MNTPRTILVVDDDEDIRTLAALALTRNGSWRVLLADSGLAAIEIARREQPDLILLDVTMPGLDGPATLEALRAEPATRGIPVVLTTAQMHRPELERLAGLGCISVLCKPFDVLQLPDELQKIVASQDQRALP